jgi:hypothetical protein
MLPESARQSFIEFDGWSKETESDKQIALSLATKAYQEIAKKIKNPVRLHIHVKRHSPAKEGRIKYTVKAKLMSAGLSYEGHSTGWAFLKAVSGSFEEVEREVRDRLPRSPKPR